MPYYGILGDSNNDCNNGCSNSDSNRQCRRKNYLGWVIFTLSVLFFAALGLVFGISLSAELATSVPALIVASVILGVMLIVTSIIAVLRRRR